MVPFLVILMVAVVLIVEYLRYRLVRRPAAEGERAGPEVVLNIDGFVLPQGLYYHPLHTWARPVEGDVAVIGIDDLARRLVGRPDRVISPSTGDRIEAGQSGALLRSGGRLAALVSPLSGEVVEINGALGREPGLVGDEPFGRGWLFKVRSSSLAEQLSNLLAGSVARSWMESSVRKLKINMAAVAGAFAQDGGEPLPDLGAEMDKKQWIRIVREFLGTEAEMTMLEEEKEKP